MYSKQGSIVFVILIFFISISVLMYSSLRNNAYFMSIAREREQHEICYQLVQALQSFALEAYAHKIKSVNEDYSKVVLFKAPWPDVTSRYEGYVWLEKEKKGNDTIKVLHTDMLLNKKVIISLKL